MNKLSALVDAIVELVFYTVLTVLFAVAAGLYILARFG